MMHIRYVNLILIIILLQRKIIALNFFRNENADDLNG